MNSMENYWNKAKKVGKDLAKDAIIPVIAVKALMMGNDAKAANMDKVTEKKNPKQTESVKHFETEKDSLAYTLDQYENDIETYSRDTSVAEGDFRKWAESFKSIVSKKLQSSSPAFKAEFQELMNLPALKYKLNALVNAVPETNPKKAEKRKQEIVELRQKVDDLEASWGKFSGHKLGTYTAANTFYYLPGQKPEDPDTDLHAQLGHHLFKMEAALRALDEENDIYREAKASIPKVEEQIAKLEKAADPSNGSQTAQK